MKIIQFERGKGKTDEAIKLAAEGFYYIICQTKEDCKRIASRAKDLGLDIPFPIDFYTFQDGQFARGINIRGFIIDDFDTLIENIVSNFINRSFYGIPLKAVSYTRDGISYKELLNVK